MEFILDDSAKAMLDEYFKENQIAPSCIRIGLRNACGVTGNTLCMRPDKERPLDVKIKRGGYTFVMLSYLAEQVGAWIRVDGKDNGGFKICTENPLDDVLCEIKGEKVQDRPMECML